MKKKFQPLEGISCQTMMCVLILDVAQVNAFRFTVCFRPDYVSKMSSCHCITFV